MAACAIEVSYQGTRFACPGGEDGCPPGFTCFEGFCLLPEDIPGPGDGDDDGPGGPPDAGEGPDDPPPDAMIPPPPPPDDAAPPQPELVTLGERPGSLVKGVTIDTFIRQDQPFSYFGSNSVLAIDASPIQRALIRFDTTSLAGRKVIDAQLVFYVPDPLEQGTLVAYDVLESWLELASWEDRAPGLPWDNDGCGPGSRANTMVASFAPVTIGEYSVPLLLTSVQAWLDTPLQNYGLVWLSTSNDGRGGEVDSSESNQPARAPELRLLLEPKLP